MIIQQAMRQTFRHLTVGQSRIKRLYCEFTQYEYSVQYEWSVMIYFIYICETTLPPAFLPTAYLQC